MLSLKPQFSGGIQKLTLVTKVNFRSKKIRFQNRFAVETLHLHVLFTITFYHRNFKSFRFMLRCNDLE